MKVYAERPKLDLQQFYFPKGQLRKHEVIDVGHKSKDADPLRPANLLDPQG